jgi:hypothetical protein
MSKRLRPKSPDQGPDQGDTTRIQDFNRLLDDISARSDAKARADDDRVNSLKNLRRDIHELSVRLTTEGFSQDVKEQMTRRIRELEKNLTDKHAFRMKTNDPSLDDSQEAAKYVLSLWSSLESSEYSELHEEDKPKLELILQHFLPEEARIYFTSLYPHLPQQLQDKQVRDKLARNLAYLLNLARDDMACYFGRNAVDNRLDCKRLDEYTEMTPDNPEIVLLKLALKISVETSLKKVSIFDSVSSMIQTAMASPVKASAAVASAGVVVAAGPSIAPLFTTAGTAVFSGISAVGSSPLTAEVMKHAMNNPGSSAAFVNYVIQMSPELLESLKNYFGIDQNAIRLLVDRMNADYENYRRREFEGDIPHSILSFYDALVYLYSFTAGAIYSQAGFLSRSIRSIFRVPAKVAQLCKTTGGAVCDGFQNLARFIQGDTGPVPFERRIMYHDRIRLAFDELPEEVSKSKEAEKRKMVLAKSDTRKYTVFESKVRVFDAEDAMIFPHMHKPISDTQAGFDGANSPDRNNPVYLAELDRAAALNTRPSLEIYGPDWNLLESNQYPTATASDAEELHTFKNRVATKGDGNPGGGKRTRRRKATTKKQKSKKNKRQSRRKSRRSSSRRSRK